MSMRLSRRVYAGCFIFVVFNIHISYYPELMTIHARPCGTGALQGRLHAEQAAAAGAISLYFFFYRCF